MESRNGGIYFGAGIDTSQFSKDVARIRNEILSITKEGQKVDLGGLKQQISIQKEAIKELEQQYKAVGKHIDSMAPGIAQAKLKAEHKEIAVAIEAEKQALKSLQEAYESFSQKHITLQTRQRQVRNEMYELTQAGKENTEQFRELAKELEELNKSIDSVKSLQNVMKGGKPAIEALTGSLRAGTGIFTAFTGVMGLFNDQSERFNAIQSRLQSVMAVSIGIEQTYQSLLKEGRYLQSVIALQMRAKAKAEALSTKNTISATIAQKAFNAVANVNPYVLLAGAILSVVGAFALFSKNNKKAKEDLQNFNKEVADSVSGMMVNYKLLQEQWKSLGDNLDKQNEFLKENKDKFRDLGVEVKNVNDAENLLLKNSDNFVEAMTLRAKASANATLAQQKFKEALEGKQELEQIERNLTGANGWFAKMTEGIKNGWSKMASDLTGSGDKAFNVLKKEWEANDFIKQQIELEKQARELLAKSGINPLSGDDDDKKKAVQSLQEHLDQRRKLWENYYKAVNLIGEDKAGLIYGSELGDKNSFLSEITERKNELQNLASLTRKQTDELVLLDEEIQKLTNGKSYFEFAKNNIDEYAQSIDNASERIVYFKSIRDALGDSFEDLQMSIHLSDQIEKEKDKIREIYNEFVNSQEETEKKRVEITLRYQTIIDEARRISDEETAKKAREEMEKELSRIDFENILNSNSFADAFKNLRYLTGESLTQLKEQLQALKNEANDLDITNIETLISRIDAIQSEETRRNPFNAFINGISDLKESTAGLEKAQDEYNRTIEEFGTSSKQALQASDNLNDARQRHYGNLKNIVEGSQEMLKIFNLTISETMALFDRFGGMGDSVKNIISDISNITNSAFTMFTGLLSKDPASIISGGMGIMSGFIGIMDNIFGGANSIERAIGRLEKAFEGLNIMLERAVGTDKILLMTKQLGILRQELETLISNAGSMAFIPDFENQLIDIEKRIHEISQSIQDAILGIDVEGMADRLADALIEAAKEGESAFDAMADSIDDILDRIVRNAISAQIAESIKPIVDGFIQNVINQTDENGQFSLDPSDVENLLSDILQASEDWQMFLDQWNDLMDWGSVTNSEINSLSGAIRGVSEETAGLLAGQIEAIRVYQAQEINIFEQTQSILQESNGYLMQIRNNTDSLANISGNLDTININIAEMNDKMDENLAGM